MTTIRATVFGGSGFIGRHIVKRLADQGAVVRVAVRDPEAALSLKPMGTVGQIVPVHGDIRDAKAVAAAVEGAAVVVNAVSLYRESRRVKYGDIHVQGAANVATAAAEHGADRLIHLSGLGATVESDSEYVQSRGFGDNAVAEAFPRASFLKPGAVFGAGDHLFTPLACFARYFWVMPLFGFQIPKLELGKIPFPEGGKTRLQPVYVGDVADAAIAALGNAKTAGQTFELGGPRVYTYRELMELLLATVERKRLLVPLPFWYAKLLAAMTEWIPGAPLTRDMVKMLREDNVVGARAKGFKDLRQTPTALETVLPTYMDIYRRGDRWQQARLA